MDITQGLVNDNELANDDKSPPETFMRQVDDRHSHQLGLFFDQAGDRVVERLDAGNRRFVRVADDGDFPFALLGQNQRVQHLGIGPTLVGVIGVDGANLFGYLFHKLGLQFGFVLLGYG